MPPPNAPLLRIPFLFFLLSAAATSAVADSLDKYDTNYPDCPIVDCGGVNISYPFWYHNHSPGTGADPSSYCGYRDFGITCRDNKTAIFTTTTDNYTVESIDPRRNTISLVDSDVIGNPCPKARHNVTITKVPALSFSPDVVGILFFFNCSTDLESDPRIPKQNAAGCLQNQAGLSYVFNTSRWPDQQYVFNRLMGACRGIPVESRVRRSDLVGKTLAGDFGKAMNSGFDLNWNLSSSNDNNMADCKKCEARSGRCGYHDDGGGLVFHCFCPDGSPHCYSKDTKLALKIGIGIAGLCLGIIVAAVCGVFLWKQRKRRLEKGNSSVTASFFKSVTPSTSSFGFGGGDLESSHGAGYYQTPMFTYEELEEATGGFSHELGDGGFGTVYKGKLKDGRVVAIKCLHQNTLRRVQQFRNEIEILNRLRHQNLVTLYGCSTRDSPKLLLVYEFVSNGTVADHLHGQLSSHHALTWALRMTVAIESAAALAYLHAVKPQIIHRDVKTSNILLDSDFHVKVADFGLSRLFPDLRVTHVSTAPQGTPGYVDPEYHQCYQLTDKSDVYSFGVVLVELVSSMPAVDITRNRNQINLSNMALEKIAAGSFGDLADASLGYGTDPEVTRMVKGVCELAFTCLQMERDMRPTMQEVLDELVRIKAGGGGEGWGEGKKPGHDKQKSSSRDDVYLLNADSQTGSSPPFSPNTVNGTSWPSRSTTPNASC